MYDFLLLFYCVLNEECDADIKIANNERYLHTHTHTHEITKKCIHVCMYFQKVFYSEKIDYKFYID